MGLSRRSAGHILPAPANRNGTLPSLGWSRADLGILGAVFVFALPITLPLLQSFFTFDDLENLAYYTSRPREALWSNLVVFTSFKRPAGALLYLPSYWILGLNPLPLYLTGFLLFHLNLGIFYHLVVRLTLRRLTAALALVVCAFHPLIGNVLFNFGAVYDLLACTSLLLGLLSYAAYRDSGKREFYWLTLGIYLVGLNAKETVVVLPALLLLLGALYLGRFDWKSHVLALTPLFGIALVYTLVKTLGGEAFWRTNPLYILHFDTTPLFNLAAYHSELLCRSVTFNPVAAGAVLAFVLAIGVGLRDRHVLFGLGFYLITLLPVLFLPRVWALFLYVPLGGAALILGRLVTLFLIRVAMPIRTRFGLPGPRTRVVVTALALLVVLRGALVWSAPQIRYARNARYFSRTFQWRDFLAQLRRKLTSVSNRSVLGFTNPPFDFEAVDRWSLHFLVWLEYDPTRTLQVFQLPQQREAFEKAAEGAPSAVEFEWQQGNLEVVKRPAER